MAAEVNLVNCDPLQTTGQFNEPGLAACEPTHIQSGTTRSEFVAKVGDLRMPGDGFADDLEAIQKEQGTAEMPELPNRMTCVTARTRRKGKVD